MGDVVLNRDYSWEDQDPEEMQAWHEFQGSMTLGGAEDSSAFRRSGMGNGVLDDDFEDLQEKSSYESEMSEVDLEIVEELLHYLTPLETEIVCRLKGIGGSPSTLVNISKILSLPNEEILASYSLSRAKLAQSDKYARFLPPLEGSQPSEI